MLDARRDSRTTTDDADRAVSEVVAFVLVFALILGSIGILYTFGFASLTDYQENEQIVNAERAMEALTDNVNDVLRYSGINQRQGELNLRDGTVGTSDDGTAVNISVGDDGDPLEEIDDGFDDFGTDSTVNLGEFQYVHDGHRIAYEGGGLVRADEDGSWSAIRKEPSVTCTEGEAAVISLVSISSDSQSVGSTAGIGVTMSVNERQSYVDDDPGEVALEVDSQYEDAWDEAVTDDWEGDYDDGWECEPDRLVVTIVDVDVEF